MFLLSVIEPLYQEFYVIVTWTSMSFPLNLYERNYDVAFKIITSFDLKVKRLHTYFFWQDTTIFCFL